MPSRQIELLEYASKESNEESYDTSVNSQDSIGGWSKTSHEFSYKKLSAAVRSEHDAIENEIKASMFILRIENELDEPDFVPYSPETWRRACNFLRRLSIHAHSCGFAGFGVPEIVPASKGSIDLLWRMEDRRLLINFPSQVDHPASYYGAKEGSEVSGRFNPSGTRPELIFWLAAR